MTPLDERVHVWKSFQPAGREPEKGRKAGQLPFPASRNMMLCLADPSDHAKVEEALGKVAKLIGPEFVLFCTMGGAFMPYFTLGIRPGIEIDVGVICRYSRVWWDLLAWWVALHVSDRNIVEFLEDRYKAQLQTNPQDLQEEADRERDKREAIVAQKQRESYVCLSTGSDGVSPDRLLELRAAATEELIRRATIVVRKFVNEHHGAGKDVKKWINQFIDEGHEDVHLLDRSQRAQLVATVAVTQLEELWSQRSRE